MRKTIHAGYIRKHRGWWEVRYRERVGMGGHIRTVHRAKRLCRVDEHHKTKKSVQDLAAEELQLINSGQHSPESVTTLGDFIERVYLPNVKATKRPSTYKGYQDLYQYHIEKRCASVWLRDVRTCDVQKWLHTFAGEDKNGAGEPICIWSRSMC